MALPFALVISVGRYLFLFLSIYTASYSPCLQHVQLATVRWFNLGDDSRNFALASLLDVDLTASYRFMSSPLAWLLHDTDTDTHNVVVTMVRLLWDPGGVHLALLFALENHSEVLGYMLSSATMLISTMVPYSAPVQGAPETATWLTPRRRLRQWDPGIVYNAGTSCRDAFVDQVRSVAPTIADMFHYTHPVLSRPTVPNITVSIPSNVPIRFNAVDGAFCDDQDDYSFE